MASAATTDDGTTTYLNVYCGELEGKLEVTDKGIFFRPYSPSRVGETTNLTATPHDILWNDTTLRDFNLSQVTAGVGGYTTEVTLYNLKLGVLPSKEVVFSLHRRDEWERLMCDLDARGYAGNVPEGYGPAAAAAQEAEEEQTGHVYDVGDDETEFYDHADAMYGDEEVHYYEQDEDVEETVRGESEAPRAPNAAASGVEWEEESYSEYSETERTADFASQAAPPRPAESAARAAMPGVAEWQEETYSEYSETMRDGEPTQYDETEFGAQSQYSEYSSYSDMKEERGDQTQTPYEETEFGQESQYSEYSGTYAESFRDEGDYTEAAAETSRAVPAAGDGDATEATGGTAADATYYPVYHHQQVGTLTLTDSQLRFVPDSRIKDRIWKLTVKTLPYNAFGAKPMFSPKTYPQALMTVHYHTTRGNKKRAVFDLDTHSELKKLEVDIMCRLMPWWNAPRDAVYVPPLGEKLDPVRQDPRRKSVGGMYGKSRAATSLDPTEFSTTHTGDDTTTAWGREDDITAAKPLIDMEGARRVPFHEEENQRRMLTLFCCCCCVVMIIVMSTAATIGYFFGPRKPKGDYVRTKAPGTMQDYMTTSPPTPAPTVFVRTEWESATATLSRNYEPEKEEEEEPVEKDVSSLRGNNNQRVGNFDIVAPPPTMAPKVLTPMPTAETPRSAWDVLQLLMEKSPDGGTALRAPGSPQQAAYLLIKLSGLLDQAPSDDMLLQKYAISTMYYANNGEMWKSGSVQWKDVATPDCIKPLVACKHASNGIVTSINMANNNVQGVIPDEIGLLTNLVHLNLRDNDIEKLPTTIGLLTNLETLDVTGNPRLELPAELLELPLLRGGQ